MKMDDKYDCENIKTKFWKDLLIILEFLILFISRRKTIYSNSKKVQGQIMPVGASNNYNPATRKVIDMSHIHSEGSEECIIWNDRLYVREIKSLKVGATLL